MATKTTLNEDQQDAFNILKRFIDHPAADTFVLLGYAGTGKTFLMQHLAGWLESKDYRFSLLAATGRAAAVLRGKTGRTAKTVHSHLYHFAKMDGIPEDLPEDAPIDNHGQLILTFAIRTPETVKQILIIDESSMLSNLPSEEVGGMIFGSGRLLNDLFEYARGHKIIFVGDPGQLPPVKEHSSPALDVDWLQQQKRVAISYTLSKNERNDPDNDILVLASMIRNMESTKEFQKLLECELNNVRVLESNENLFRSYFKSFKEKGPNQTIAIARTNLMVNNINMAMRRDLFQDPRKPIQEGEVLLVTYNNRKALLTNGDFVVVVRTGASHVHTLLRFQEIRIRSLLTDSEQDLYISLDILEGPRQNFTETQLQTLTIDFSRRMKKIDIEQASDEYQNRMMNDPYLNCLRAKFGYGVTCHKAQGGERGEVFLFLDKNIRKMPHPALLRWWYTAVTRAKQTLYLSKP
jgi:ATP-dependent exoDNAse (exonuclease V) alpha subunit